MRYKSFRYQAESWSKPRRIVAKVEHHLGELFPARRLYRDEHDACRVGLWCASTTSAARPSNGLKKASRPHTGRGFRAIAFRANEVRLQLSVLAYNLGNLWRRLGLPQQDQELVADELAAAADEDRWAAGQACPLLLAAAGGGASEPASCSVTCCGRIWALPAAERVALNAASDRGQFPAPKRFRREASVGAVSSESARWQCRNVCERMDELWRPDRRR